MTACPSPGCPETLAPDPETPVLRCSMHGPMTHKSPHDWVSEQPWQGKTMQFLSTVPER